MPYGGMPGSVLREAKWGALRTQLDMSAKRAQDKHQEGDGGKGKAEPPALEWVKVESDLPASFLPLPSQFHVCYPSMRY